MQNTRFKSAVVSPHGRTKRPFVNPARRPLHTNSLTSAGPQARADISLGICIYPTRPIPCLRGARMEAYVHSQYRVGYGLGSVQQAGETRPMDSLAVLSNVAAAAQAGGNIPPADMRYQDPTTYAHNNSHGSSPMAEALGAMKSQNMDLDPISPPRGHQTPR